MGSEFLPDYLDGENEIAGVALQSVADDVISIRAQQVEEEIACRVVDEYDTVFDWTPRASFSPLTSGELINLIDSVKHNESLVGLTGCFRDMNYKVSSSPQGLRDFLSVRSAFYMELYPWYAEESEERVRKRNQ